LFSLHYNPELITFHSEQNGSMQVSHFKGVIILGSYRHKTSITFTLAEISVQILSMADTNIKIHTK
jgi:hypothetical protein